MEFWAEKQGVEKQTGRGCGWKMGRWPTERERKLVDVFSPVKRERDRVEGTEAE